MDPQNQVFATESRIRVVTVGVPGPPGPQGPPGSGAGAQFDDAEGQPTSVGTSASADGTSANAARRDHKHDLDTSETDARYLRRSSNLSDVQSVSAARGNIGAAADASVVHNVGNESVSGVKTFSDSPAVPTPATSTSATPKSYVDTGLSGKAASVHAHAESDVTSLVADLAGKAPTSRLISNGTGITGGGDLTADRTLSVVDNSTTQKIEVAKAGTLIGTRKRLNLIEGSNVTLTVADNGGSDRVDVTVTSVGGTDTNAVHLTGTETITGEKTFLNADQTIQSGTLNMNSSDLVFTGGGGVSMDGGDVELTDGDLIVANGNISLDPTSSLSAASGSQVFVPAPTAGGHAANKTYVDSVAQGLIVKDAVRVASTGNVTLSSPGASIDGVTLSNGDRILLKNQTTGSENGIYVFDTSSTPLVRSTDADTSGEVPSGIFTFVTEGTVNANSGWILTTPNPITLNTTSLAFTQFSGAGQITAGTGMTKTGNTLDVGAGSGITVGADTVAVDFTAVQAKNALLDALSALSGTGLIVRTGGGAVIRAINTGSNKLSITNSDGVSGNPTLDVAEANLTLTNLGGTLSIAKGGTGQTSATTAYDALSPNTTLGDISYRGSSNNLRLPGNTSASKRFLTQTGTGSVSAAPAWSTIAESDVANLTVDLAAKANDSAVVHNTGDETIAGIKTFSSPPVVPTPVASGDATNKSYVDAIANGLLVKAPVRAATTANITLSGLQTIDGISLSANDRVLVKNQTTASQNGIYTAASGAWSRATDADASAEVKGGLYVIVNEGTAQADTAWVLTTNDPITLGSTGLTFTQFSGPGSTVPWGNITGTLSSQTDLQNALNAKLTAASNLSDVASVSTARTNLGLGTIATQAANNVSITGGSITGITDLAVADGGTGASSAAQALTNLGAVAKAGDTMTGALVITPGANTTATLAVNNSSATRVLTVDTTNQRVGVGTSSPTTALDVTGVTRSSGGFDAASQKIVNVLDPTAAQDAATKAYVDAFNSGLSVSTPVRVATTANITLSGTQTIDGVALSASDRVLVKDQTTGSDNGIYDVASGAWSRSTDADTSAEMKGGKYVFVNEGTTNADTSWVLTTNDPITLGSTSLTFSQFSGLGQITAGAGLTKTGNTLNVGAGTGITVAADTVSVDMSAVQAADTDLAAVAALSTTGLIARTGAGTAATRTITAASSKITITNGDGVSGNPTIDATLAVADLTDGSSVVKGPASATDTAIPRFNTTSGKLLQNSAATIDGSGNLLANTLNATDKPTTRSNLGSQSKTAIVVGPTGDLGYVTDGTADNVQIAAAMTTAQAVGAEVHLQEGVFDMAAQIVFHNKSNITVRGAGKGKTILRTSYTTNTSILDIGSGSGPTAYGNITFTDFTIDHNGTHPGWGLVLTWCYNVLVENVSFVNPKSGGTGNQLFVGKFTTAGATDPDLFEARNITIRNCDFDYTGATLTWEYVGCIAARDVLYEGCRWNGTGGGGGGRQGMLVYLSEQVRFVGCFFDHTTLGIGGRGSYAVLGCHFEQSVIQFWKARNVFVGGGTTFREDPTGNILGTSNGLYFQGGYELGGEGETAWFNINFNFATTDVDTTNNTIAISDTTDFPTGTAIGIGTTGTRPSPFVADTIYYAINVDATHLKVATSQANALAGTAIDITTQGTGTHAVGVNVTWNCENLVIDGVIFESAKDTAIRAKTTTEHGIRVLDARDLTITNCKFDRSKGIPLIAFAKILKVTGNEFINCNTNNVGSTNVHMIVAGEDVTIAENYSNSPNMAYDIQVDHLRYTDVLGNMTLHLDPGGLSAAALVRYYDSGGVLQVQPTSGVTVDLGVNDYKDAVRVATAAALPANTASSTLGTLTASSNGALSAVDGVSLSLFDRVLVKNESTGSKNGVYYVYDLGDSTTPWILKRSFDAKHSALVKSGLTVRSTEGTANANKLWVLTTANPITLGTTSLTFSSATTTGDVVGPGSATDNAIVRFDSTTGKLVQNSTATLGDDAALALTHSGTTTIGLDLQSSATTGRGINLAANSLTSGYGMLLTTTANATGNTDGFAYIRTQGTTGNINTLKLLQDGTGNALFIDNNNSGASISIDHDASTASAIKGIFIDVDNASTGGVYGIDIANVTSTSSEVVGLRIAAPSGGTTNYALQLSSTAGTAAGGITLGTDTNLYRSAANTLKTDDSLDVVGTLTAGTYAGQGSIATVGTITSGTWNGTTIAIANGGTGQTTASAAFGALSPLTTKGDLLTYSTVNARLGVGTNGQVLTADSTQTTGLKWSTVSASPGGSDTQVQFNDSSAFGGDAGLTYNKTSNILSSGGFKTSGNTGSITSVIGLDSTAISDGSLSSTNLTHVSIANASGTVSTSQIGIDIGALTTGGTSDIGIRVAKADTYTIQLSDTGGTAAGGITFGTDTTLYRSAADTLKTDDSLVVSGTLTASGTIELGNASDTTLSRSSAGVLAVEGVVVPTISSTNTLTNKTLTAPIIATISNTGTLTLPTSTDTLVGRATTDTLTNKRITKRVTALTDGANIATDSDSMDVGTVTLGGNRTMDNPTGTPTNGQLLQYRIRQDGTGGRTLAWGNAFRFGTTVPQPTLSTGINKTDYVGFQYNSTDSTWDCIAFVGGL